MKKITKANLSAWSNKIGKRIFELKTSRKMYESFIENHQAGKFNEYGIEFAWWIRTNYENSIIILLTGLLEASKKHDDDMNFQKFLNAVDKYGINNLKNELYNDKPMYFSDFDNPVHETLEDDDPLEIDRKLNIDKTFSNLDIKKDIESINSRFLILKDFRDKQIAHFTSNEEDFNITNADLDKIIDEIITIFDKYSFIICNDTYVFD